MTITVAQISSKDWQAYKTIQLEALKQDPQAFGSSYDTWVNATDKKWQERPSNPDSIILFAKDDDVSIGLIGVHFENAAAEVWGMYVNKNYRRKGIGKLLMQNLLDKIHSNPRNAEKITLMVNPQQEAAVKLYESLGFKKVGMKNYMLGDGKRYELLIMEQKLRSINS